MLRIPLVLLFAAWAATPLACREEEASVSTTAGIPFDAHGHLDGGPFTMTSGAGDTLWFRIEFSDGPYARVVRVRRSRAGLDSLSARIDLRTKAPISSHHEIRTGEGAHAAEVLYGAGYEGQARVTVTTPRGRRVDNLRAPPPYLDPAQLPQTFSALDFARPDTFTFNYVAPFENDALNAQVVIGPLETLALATGPAPAYPVRLRVSGLEERFWFAAPPGRYRLLRWHDVTRGVTWTRVEPSAP
jgi:hypothetical protein